MRRNGLAGRRKKAGAREPRLDWLRQPLASRCSDPRASRRMPPKASTSPSQRKETAQHMTQATEALVTAHDALIRKYPGRRVGNIIVTRLTDGYRVLLIDLPAQPAGSRALKSVTVTVSRQSDTIGEFDEAEVAATPYRYSEGPGRGDFAGRQAFDRARAALEGHETFDKEGMLTVELDPGRLPRDVSAAGFIENSPRFRLRVSGLDRYRDRSGGQGAGRGLMERRRRGPGQRRSRPRRVTPPGIRARRSRRPA